MQDGMSDQLLVSTLPVPIHCKLYKIVPDTDSRKLIFRLHD